MIKILIIYHLILETWIPFVFFHFFHFFSATTDAKDYLGNFNLLEVKVNPARQSYRVYNHALHKQVSKLTELISSVYVHVRFFQCLKLTNYFPLKLIYFII